MVAPRQLVVSALVAVSPAAASSTAGLDRTWLRIAPRQPLEVLFTYQLYSPIGLDLRPLERALKDPRDSPQNGPWSVRALGYLGGSLRQLQVQPCTATQLIGLYS